MAIAGGTELLLHPDQFVPWSFNGCDSLTDLHDIQTLTHTHSMANPEGQCFAFDSRGAGYGRGEGIGTVILKRLSHAIQDGDPVHSVILNSGINQDGKTAGILLPNSNAQAALVKQVYESAGLNPAHTLYVEAHGTVSHLPPLHLSKPLFPPS
jgi:acyl transferase domain-containing protein